RGGDQQLALAAALHVDPLRGDTPLDELIAHPSRALERERVVGGMAPARVGVADHEDLRRGTPRELGQDLAHHRERLRRELVLALEEVDGEGRRPQGLGIEGGAERPAHLAFTRASLLETAFAPEAGGVIGLIERGPGLAMRHLDRGGGAVPGGQEHDELLARGPGAGGGEQQREGEEPERERAGPSPHRDAPALTGRTRRPAPRARCRAPPARWRASGSSSRPGCAWRSCPTPRPACPSGAVSRTRPRAWWSRRRSARWRARCRGPPRAGWRRRRRCPRTRRPPSPPRRTAGCPSPPPPPACFRHAESGRCPSPP